MNENTRMLNISPHPVAAVHYQPSPDFSSLQNTISPLPVNISLKPTMQFGKTHVFTITTKKQNKQKIEHLFPDNTSSKPSIWLHHQLSNILAK